MDNPFLLHLQTKQILVHGTSQLSIPKEKVNKVKEIVFLMIIAKATPWSGLIALKLPHLKVHLLSFINFIRSAQEDF